MAEIKAEIFILKNTNNIEVHITNYGGIITSIRTPDRHGVFRNIVLGLEKVSDYQNEHPYLGAIIGRYCNRIAGGSFQLNSKKYKLAKNNGDNHLHGGEKGFDKVLWEVESSSETYLELTYLSPDGEEGYPGNLNVKVTYQLTDADELIIKYEAVTDKDTPVNLTNHSYFNLTGDSTISILEHQLTINAHNYTPLNGSQIPTGEIRNVKGTPFDFTTPREIGSAISDVDGGYDHNFVVDHHTGDLRLVAIVLEPVSGRKLIVHSTKPGIQFYSGNFLNGKLKDSQGHNLNKHTGFCLETQHFPNAPNEPAFPDSILLKDGLYRHTTIYQFSVNP